MTEVQRQTTRNKMEKAQAHTHTHTPQKPHWVCKTNIYTGSASHSFAPSHLLSLSLWMFLMAVCCWAAASRVFPLAELTLSLILCSGSQTLCCSVNRLDLSSPLLLLFCYPLTLLYPLLLSVSSSHFFFIPVCPPAHYHYHLGARGISGGPGVSFWLCVCVCVCVYVRACRYCFQHGSGGIVHVSCHRGWWAQFQQGRLAQGKKNNFSSLSVWRVKLAQHLCLLSRSVCLHCDNYSN